MPGSGIWFRRLRNTAFAVIDQIAEELRHSDFVPMAFELSFGGKDGTLPAVTVSLPDGDLRVGGKVDRVDGWIRTAGCTSGWWTTSPAGRPSTSRR